MVVLICNSPITPSRMLFCYRYIFFGELSVQIFGPFFIELFVYLLLFYEISFTFSIPVLCQICVSQISSPSLWLTFSSP